MTDDSKTESHASTPKEWLPIPEDGDYTGDAFWGEALSRVSRPVDLDAAFAGLRDIFSNEWARHHRRLSDHPVVVWFATYSGRIRLLEVGLGLHALQGVTKRSDMKERLRDAERFSDTCSELRVGHWLTSLGAELRHEVIGSNGKRCDWLATWPSGSLLAVEVKRSDISDYDERAVRATMIYLSLIQLALAKEPDLMIGLEVTFAIAPAFIERCPMSPEAIQSELVGTVGAMLSSTREAISAREFPATAVVENIAALRVTPAEGTTLVRPAIVRGEDEHAVSRLHGLIAYGKEQLAGQNATGVLVVDVEQNPRGLLLAKVAYRRSPDHESLGGMLVLDADPVATGTRDRFDLVAGPAGIALEEILGASRCQSCRAFHFQPTIEPSTCLYGRGTLQPSVSSP